jgi:hypothetical protein
MKKKEAPKSFNIKDTIYKNKIEEKEKATTSYSSYIPYPEKLKSPRWQRKRLEIMSRDNFACRCCLDENKTLNVHHIYYDNRYKNPWDYPSELLITMCESCHKIEHEYKFEDIAVLLLKELIYLSNKPVSEINNILDHKHYLINCEDYAEKEAIKQLLLKLIQGL